MFVYHLRLQPDARAIHHGAQPLTAEIVENLIDGASVQRISGGELGYPAELEFQLEQEPNDAAVNTILTAVERCGYNVAEGEISSWIDGQAQGFIWGLGAGAGAGALTKSGPLMIIAGLAGALAGQLAGSKLHKHEVIYQIRRPYPGARAELAPVNNAAIPKITLADWFALGGLNPQAG